MVAAFIGLGPLAPLTPPAPLVRSTARSRAPNTPTVLCAASSDEPLLVRTVRGQDVERTPVWLMRQAGRYMADFRAYSDKIPFRERSETPDIAVELSMQPYRAFKTDGVIMFSDILTPLPAVGIEFDIVRKRGPVFGEPLRTREDIEKVLDFGEFDPQAKLGFVAEILQRLRVEIDTASDPGDRPALIGFVGLPWTLAAYAVEGASSRNMLIIKRLLQDDPEIVAKLLDKLTDMVIQYIIFQADAGAQIVQLFDSWAHGLTPRDYAQWSAPYTARILREVRAARPDLPLIFFANGSAGKLGVIQDSLLSDSTFAPNAVGIDWATDMSETRKTFGDAVVLQGNIDPTVLFGPDEAIRQAVRDTCKDAEGGPLVLGLGHGVMQGTPERSVGLLCEYTRQFTSA